MQRHRKNTLKSIRAAMEADTRLRRGWSNQGVMKDLFKLIEKGAWDEQQIAWVLSGHRSYLGAIDFQATVQRLRAVRP